ncbi:protein-export chaperone SecB [Acetobacter sp. AN02]|uniref:protein-export chaperone SecB n=1 Tax=Acetobacter sp. AN02 TaxID=2894186 RepID=UPI0024344DA4|nr:protein-export chaperone SecB [Acetobacter sp. AN02]MDG6094185.1 protein-export chaperone SecB [Acetobacter sp. AN02]
MNDSSVIDTVAGAVQGEGNSAPSLLIGAQYLRSTRFVIIDDPTLHTRPPIRPEVLAHIDVAARQIADNSPDFEVSLVLRCQGFPMLPKENEPSQPRLFEAEFTWAGLFSLRNSTAETFEPLLLVEAPRMLFPGARNYLADLTRDAGFSPVLLHQIDFLSLWHSRRGTKASEGG